MEPIYVIQTEIPEHILGKILTRTYPKRLILRSGIFALIEIVCGIYLLCAGVYLQVFYQHPRAAYYIVFSAGVLLFGMILLIKTVRAPRAETEKWIRNLRMQTGRNDWNLHLEFLEEEFQAVNPYAENEKEKIHIPYDYVQKIYDMDDVLILAAKTGRMAIMKQDIPGEEFLPWLLSKCNRVSVKTI